MAVRVWSVSRQAQIAINGRKVEDSKTSPQRLQFISDMSVEAEHGYASGKLEKIQ
jgi:hypothetical protein